jgi:hypothetical protein
MDRTPKAVLLAVALAFLPFASVHGQAPSPPATVAAPADESPGKPATPKRRARSQEDARTCLDLATNLEVIACAEKYR